MVITLHYLNKTMGMGMDDTISVKGILTHSIESICIVACNLFVLVSAWFLADKKSIKIRKVVDIVLVLVFYGCIIYAGCILKGITVINGESLKTFIDTMGYRWFVIIYIIFYLLVPYINKGICHLSKKDLRNVIIVMIIFFSIWPTIYNGLTVGDSGYGIINFILLYFICYYIKKYTNYKKIKIYKLFSFWLISTIITTIFSFIEGRAWAYNSIFVIIASVTLFLMMARIEISRNKLLSYISSFSLSTYIIHENIFIRTKIYQGIFKSDYYSHTKLLLVNMLICVVSIFIGCMIIEIIRRILFKYTIDKGIDKIKILNPKIEIKS